jgi:predicted HicB family RNase H-like nuclease
MLRVSPLIHAAAIQASARQGQSLNKSAENALKKAAHA